MAIYLKPERQFSAKKKLFGRRPVECFGGDVVAMKRNVLFATKRVWACLHVICSKPIRVLDSDQQNCTDSLYFGSYRFGGQNHNYKVNRINNKILVSDWFPCAYLLRNWIPVIGHLRHPRVDYVHLKMGSFLLSPYCL